MKFLFTIVIVFSFLAGSTQPPKTKEIKIKREQMKSVKTIKDLIIDIPKDCKVGSFVFSMSLPGDLKEYSMLGEEFGKDFTALFTKPENIKKIFIEELKTECPNAVSKNYIILFE